MKNELKTYNKKTREKIKKEIKKHSALKGIRIHDLSDTGAVLFQLSYEA